MLVPLLTLLAARRGAASPTHGTVQLVSEQSSIQPGRPLWVGLQFQLEPGWHIYWTNPGDSGEPPQVKWNLPPGFQAGPLHWPIPRRIEDHSLIDFGYQNQVLLPLAITPPARRGQEAEVRLNATVNWLVCREICVPARADLSLRLPVKNGPPQPASTLMRSLFAKARAELPQPAPKFWKVTATLDGRFWVLNVDAGKPESQAIFFPLEPNQIEDTAPQKAIPSSRGIRLEMVKSDQMLKPPSRLAGVLEWAEGQGYFIEAPVIARQ